MIGPKSICLILGMTALLIPCSGYAQKQPDALRILVVTGGHDYDRDGFTRMLSSLGREFVFEIREFPSAFAAFQPQNRNEYDVLVFYHMWQQADSVGMKAMSECIAEGKPLVVLHHSICAFDGWPEYTRITGSRYFHQSQTIDGVQYPVSSYIHDRSIPFHVVDPEHPVTKGIADFTLFDESYKGYYVNPGVTPLLTTSDTTSTPVTGWAWHYGKARVVTLQSGHDTPTFDNPVFRKLLKQAIVWVTSKE
jgi:uncharacterized protein